MPLAFLHDTWQRARDAASSHLLRFIFETRAGSNSTVDPTLTGTPKATAPVTTISFFDPSSIYTSGYALGVMVMVILINRVQHIVIPPRTMAQPMQPEIVDDDVDWNITDNIPARARTALNAVRRRALPINVKSTTTRFLIMLPSLLHSYRTLALLLVSMLQVPVVSDSSFSSSYFGRAYLTMANWGLRMDMYHICWMAFTSSCFLVVSGALLAGLEGQPGSAPNFNLLGYACLLHSFGSPRSYNAELKNADRVWRPSVHVLFVMFQPLFQGTLLHSLNVVRSWGSQRLAPTTLCALVTLFHFWYTLLTDPRWHPYPTFLTNVIETLILTIIVVTHSLDFITRFLLSPASSPSSSSPFFLAPSSWSTAVRSMELVASKDEFQVALVKICVACLDATNFVGLANEVAYVRGGGALARVARFISDDTSDSHPREHGPSVQLGATEVVIRRPPEHSNSSGTTIRRRTRGIRSRSSTPAPFEPSRVGGRHATHHTGLAREIKHVAPLQRGRDGGVLPGVGGYWMSAFQRPEARRLIRSIIAFFRGMWRWIRSFVRYGRRPPRRRDHELLLDRLRVQGREDSDLTIPRLPKGKTTFLDVAYPEDDSDSDYIDDGDDAHSTGTSESEYEYDHSGKRYAIDDPQANDTVVLYSDIKPSEAPILLAHLPAAHMTRSKYIPPSSFPFARPNSGISNDEARRTCVICMSEPRAIICWPCRCLSLCDECRGSLAARSATSKHHCPCCRQSVEGYSRIFIP